MVTASQPLPGRNAHRVRSRLQLVRVPPKSAWHRRNKVCPPPHLTTRQPLAQAWAYDICLTYAGCTDRWHAQPHMCLFAAASLQTPTRPARPKHGTHMEHGRSQGEAKHRRCNRCAQIETVRPPYGGRERRDGIRRAHDPDASVERRVRKGAMGQATHHRSSRANKTLSRS